MDGQLFPLRGSTEWQQRVENESKSRFEKMPELSRETNAGLRETQAKLTECSKALFNASTKRRLAEIEEIHAQFEYDACIATYCAIDASVQEAKKKRRKISAEKKKIESESGVVVADVVNNEIVVEKPVVVAESVIEKPVENVIEKPVENVVEKPNTDANADKPVEKKTRKTKSADADKVEKVKKAKAEKAEKTEKAEKVKKTKEAKESKEVVPQVSENIVKSEEVETA